MRKPTKPRLDPLKIYMNAERYRIAYLVMRIAGDKDPNLMTIIASPHMVISAFATELYFKCLLCLEAKGVPQTHNLKALFRDLAPATRARIEELWKVHARTLEDLWSVMEQTLGKTVPRDFATLIDISSSAFNELRYLHEDSSGAFMVGDLPPILRTVILERQPLWASVRHAPPTSLPRGTLTQHANQTANQRGDNQ